MARVTLTKYGMFVVAGGMVSKVETIIPDNHHTNHCVVFVISARSYFKNIDI